MDRISISPFHPDAIPDLIRLGRDNDGGYVVSRASIAAADVVLSFGINDDVSFEADCAHMRPDARIICFDPTVSAGILARRCSKLAAVAVGCALLGQFGAARRKYGFARRYFEFTSFFKRPNTTLHRLWIAAVDRPGSISVDTVFRSFCEPDDRVFVKMDIEGAEYGCLEAIVVKARQMTGFAIELHDVTAHWSDLMPALERLREYFFVAHAHGNNFDGFAENTDIPNTLELSFVAKQLVEAGGQSCLVYPVSGLDMPNHHRIPDMALDFAS